METASLLYVSHALLELLLGALKLRGRYAHERGKYREPRSAMYTRHHGCSLLSLSMLGALIWMRGLVDLEAGAIASACLALMHGGAVASFVIAWVQGAIPFVKVIVPHAPFALGFTWHVIAHPYAPALLKWATLVTPATGSQMG
uniref:Uncharacterized protein n=1 Tax=Calcidiscus leptoporus TaxID=127549 RepID=A0A7S0JM76_9EUKA|mmetsp:Transcript_8986/g.20957  ORF Transcript_8986/g.20957 Transcript_8986/m.20957 type:complete len:144 (+) Transcript_8986:83-514(+)